MRTTYSLHWMDIVETLRPWGSGKGSAKCHGDYFWWCLMIFVISWSAQFRETNLTWAAHKLEGLSSHDTRPGCMSCNWVVWVVWSPRYRLRIIQNNNWIEFNNNSEFLPWESCGRARRYFFWKLLLRTVQKLLVSYHWIMQVQEAVCQKEEISEKTGNVLPTLR